MDIEEDEARLEHLRLLLLEASAVYEAAEKAGVKVEIGHYRRLAEGQSMVARLRAAIPEAEAVAVAPEWPYPAHWEAEMSDDEGDLMFSWRLPERSLLTVDFMPAGVVVCYVDGDDHKKTWAVTLGETNPPLPDRSGEAGALRDIGAERARQVSKEGWTAEHDDGHNKGQLARAASAYAYFASLPECDDLGRNDREQGGRRGSYVHFVISQLFPVWGTNYGGWDWKWWKPTDRRRDLVKAGALIVAEIERLDRATTGGRQ